MKACWFNCIVLNLQFNYRHKTCSNNDNIQTDVGHEIYRPTPRRAGAGAGEARGHVTLGGETRGHVALSPSRSQHSVVSVGGAARSHRLSHTPAHTEDIN